MLVILVCFVVVMMVWLLANLSATDPVTLARANTWLPWFACVLLGLAVFVSWGPGSALR